METNHKNIARLQLITQRTTKEEILKETTMFLEGGGRWVQLRMKEASQIEIESVAIELLAVCKKYGATLLINDSPQIAKNVGADGVHIGKSDISPKEARKILGEEKIIGGTANTMLDVKFLIESGIDYIGLGPYRYTSTKKNLSPILGTDGYTEIINTAKNFPIIAIGGITIEDIPLINSCGVRYYAISGAISNADDPKAATQEFLEIINKEKL